VGERRVIELERSILEKNARLAERLRGMFWGKGVLAINMVSSPGSGKTTLLEATLGEGVFDGLRAGVIVGDLATDNDAARIKATGAPAVQVTTGDVCHLDAHMLLHAIGGPDGLDLDAVDLLFIENVGNLVCPAAFDLGEDLRVVLTSVCEGEDKPLKYPTIFQGVALVVITKTDLAEAVEVDLAALEANIHEVAPSAQILQLSARTGAGLEGWRAFLEAALAAKV
jgi:hydrogenase nickel incorporation protein HypB